MNRTRSLIYNTLMEEAYSGFQQITDYGELCDELSKDRSTFNISYRGVDTSMEEDFSYCCRAVYAAGNISFAVDEVDLHSSPLSLPKPFEYLISIGRHRNTDIYVASRRCYSIHPLIRSQCSELYTFIQTEPRDIAWLTELIGREKAESCSSLQQYKYLYWNDNPQLAHTTESE